MKLRKWKMVDCHMHKLKSQERLFNYPSKECHKVESGRRKRVFNDSLSSGRVTLCEMLKFLDSSKGERLQNYLSKSKAKSTQASELCARRAA